MLDPFGINTEFPPTGLFGGFGKNNLIMQVPAECQTQLQKIYDLGTTVYTPDGLVLYLSTKLPEFANKTGYEMLLAGKYDDVMVHWQLIMKAWDLDYDEQSHLITSC